MSISSPTHSHRGLRSSLAQIALRDIQLWSMLLLVLVIVAALLSVVLPNLMWKSEPMRVESRYLPQFIFGFIGLVVLFNLHVFEQKRKLHRLREQLTQRLVTLDNDETGVAADPQTKLFSREFATELIAKEAKRVERARSPLTVIAVAIEDFAEISRAHGELATDHLLLVAARILKTTFRGSDTICRYGPEEFLVILPDTAPAQARYAIERLERVVDFWNATTDFAYELRLMIGVASHTAGDPARTVEDAMNSSRKQRRFQVFTSKPS